MSDSNKGSRPRPYSISQHQYDTRWDNIFDRKIPLQTVEEYRVNNQGHCERFREGQWEIDPSKG